jgi:hypothetical protein
VKVAEGPWRIVAVMAIAAVALAFAASAVRRQMPGPVRHERAACNADARAVEVAADAYRATTYVWPANMKALTSASVGSEPYLRAAPSGKHYTMTIGPDGVVLVNGQSYDAGMVGQGPNPCSRIR